MAAYEGCNLTAGEMRCITRGETKSNPPSIVINALDIFYVVSHLVKLPRPAEVANVGRARATLAGGGVGLELAGHLGELELAGHGKLELMPALAMAVGARAGFALDGPSSARRSRRAFELAGP
ncbi:hypothetical protein NL676_018443 [Syzygium grande]|nr:hypothetical protein NL676_018443 [Syzygium grande]